MSVHVAPAPDGVRVIVKDSGLGIPKTDLPHIFDKYYQAANKPTAGEKGTGLGLAIVREIVMLHQGRIDVTSELKHGTAFTVYLPMQPQTNVATAGITRAQADKSDLTAKRPTELAPS